MARDISIAISAKDNFSQAITTMRNANQHFDKDLTGLQSKLNELNKTKILIKVDTNKAESALKEAEKQFARTGKAADKLKLEMANANYENARRNLSLVADNAKQAENEIRDLTDAVSKAENRAGKATASSMNGIIKTLAASGAFQMVGSVLGNVATTRVGSAFGSEAGILTSNMLSSATQGAIIGTSIAPGIGTVVGALGGAALGYMQGQNVIFENEDKAFKSYYENLHNSVLEAQNKSLASGTNVAATRETDKITFSALLGGDSEAREFLGDLTDFAAVTPFAYDDLANISKAMLAYGYQQDELLPLLAKVGEAGFALGMSTEDMKYVAMALGRMQTTGETTLEYLNPLLERNIDVWSYLTSASGGRTKEEVQEMVSNGSIPGEEAAKIIADYMGADFAGSMEKQVQTYSGLVSNLEDARLQLDNAMGEGYNNTRKEGLQEQIDWLNGESGEEMQKAYRRIAQWKASLENLSEQYERDAFNSVMTGTIADSFAESEQREALKRVAKEYAIAQADYYDASKAGDEKGMQEAEAAMGQALAETQAIGANEYNASEGAQLALKSAVQLAENIRNDSASNEAYWNAGYVKGQEFTKGLASAITGKDASAGTQNSYSPEAVQAYLNSPYARRNAYGLSYVPYNDYPALLHEGERVLTASENRNYGSGTPINITGNTFVVRKDDDIRGVAQEIARLINQAYVLAI